jgi:hypothetical protein
LPRAASLGVSEPAKALHQIEELAVDLDRINRRPAHEVKPYRTFGLAAMPCHKEIQYDITEAELPLARLQWVKESR